MTVFKCLSRSITRWIPALVLGFVAGCGGGGLDPILGTPGATAIPRVTATSPVAASPVVTGVAHNARVTAAFSKPMAGNTINRTSFTLACPAGTPVIASVSHDSATNVATLIPAAPLPPSTLCVATLTSAVQDTMGLGLGADYVWSFVTAPADDVTAPTVAMTSPAAGTTNAASNTVVTATFSEDMKASSLTASSFTLVNTTLGTAVPGSVSYSASGRMVVFTPSTPATLAASSQFRATVTTGATDLAGNALAVAYSWTFGTAALPDTTRPTVVMVVPAASATSVPNNTRVAATFSEDMDPATLSGTTFTVLNTALGTRVPGTVSYSATSRTVLFTPNTPTTLADNSPFTATVTTAATDLAGNALAASFTWSFTTAVTTDTTRPTVVLTVPGGNAAGVANNSAITATFSEAMNPATLSASSFTLVNTTQNSTVPGTVSYSAPSRTVIFTPSTPTTLAANSQFTATITPLATDLAGNALAIPFSWTFTTAAGVDTTRPTVVLTVPSAGATAVANNSLITATFSEDMNPVTLSATSFTLVNTALGTAVPGTVSYSATSRTVLFTPSTPATLAGSSQFTATVTTAATDLAGNALAANVSWSFTTAAVSDTTRPSVVLTVPAANATGVANNSKITATFSEDMNPETLSATSVTLLNTTLGTAVPGIVSYSATSRTVIFTPSSPVTLNGSSGFTATVTNAATDLAGNALAANYSWSFNTAALGDTTRPTVVLLRPAADIASVPNNTKVTATFSEDMNPDSISAASFTLVHTTLGTAVPGTVSYSVAAKSAIFTPSTPATLTDNTRYTATVTTAVTDLAGNALASNVVWTFTIGVALDIIAPTVTAVSPPDTNTAVCLTKPLTATFSEPMDPTTITTTTFVVSDNGVAVLGNVSYDVLTQRARFVPTAATGLVANRPYVVTLKSGFTGMKDVSGNPMAVDRSWGFTTSAQACLGAINLGSAASFGAFGGAAGITNQGINTVVVGNLGSTAVCTAITGFHDAAKSYTETPLNEGAVNGSIYCAPPAPGTTATLAIATQARADAQAAYNALAALPAGSDPGAGQLGGLTLAGGVYTAAGGSFNITTGDLTLDAQGDDNVVWVFQSASALTVGQPALPRRVLLINGAQARNVYWQIGSAGRIEDRSVMVGTLIAPAGVTISTAGQSAQTLLTGRAIGLTASVTMVNTTIVAP